MAKADEMCMLFTDYILGELSDSQMMDYEKHLDGCDYCKSEYETFWPTHRMLLSDTCSEVPNPQLLEQKSQVLANAYSKRKPRTDSGLKPGPSRWRRDRRHGRKWRWLVPLTALVGCLLVVGVIARNVPSGQTQTPPVNLLARWPLVSVGKYPKAQGVILVVHHRSKKNLIVYVNHVPVQSEWGCYNVWGVVDGQRYSLGEFTVDNNGDGAITVDLDPKQHFDKLEITLEPRWGDSTPQGPDVLHSSAFNV